MWAFSIRMYSRLQHRILLSVKDSEGAGRGALCAVWLGHACTTAALILLGGCSLWQERSIAWAEIAGNEWHTCGIDVAGLAYCWGESPGSRVGTSSALPSSTTPLRVAGDTRFRQIAVGESMVCAVSTYDAAYCWGNNELGQIGDGTTQSRPNPTAVSGAYRWKRITAGSSHVCGITLIGEAYCWGNRFRGKLGDGELSGFSSVPVKVPANVTFVRISAGVGSTCAISEGGSAYCWGVNDFGRLGDGGPPEAPRATPMPSLVVGQHRFAEIGVGAYSACAITTAGRTYCWGQTPMGETAEPPTSVPTALPSEFTWKAVVSGSGHVCALTTSGSAYCWGNNEHGQLGNGKKYQASRMTPVEGRKHYVAIASGGRHVCALDGEHRALCWGRGDFGQLGNGGTTDRTFPTRVKNPE